MLFIRRRTGPLRGQHQTLDDIIAEVLVWCADLVRSPGASGKSHEVIESRKHPDYDAFQQYLGQDPFFVA